jgi:hypothetical protein
MFFSVEPFDISCLHFQVILLVSMAGMSVCYAILGIVNYLRIYASIYCLLGTSDFVAHMSGIKILKGDEILRPVYEKNCFPKY